MGRIRRTSAARSRGSSWIEAGVTWIDDRTIVFQAPDSTSGSPSCKPDGDPPGRGLRSNESAGVQQHVLRHPGLARQFGLHLPCPCPGIQQFSPEGALKALYEFRLHQQEKFLYICDTLHMWEWDIQVLDIHEGTKEDEEAACLGGRGATQPEFCGGPTGYRLMLKRQSAGSAMLAPAMVETGILMLAEACPDQPP